MFFIITLILFPVTDIISFNNSLSEAKGNADIWFFLILYIAIQFSSCTVVSLQVMFSLFGKSIWFCNTVQDLQIIIA